MKTSKKAQTLLTVLALLLASMAGLRAQTSLIVDWFHPDGSVASVIGSSGSEINKSNSLTILLGTFSSTNWSQVNRANLTNSFVQYAASTFSSNQTTFTINNPPTNAVTAYMVLTSGQSDLGIFYWAYNYGNGSTMTVPMAEDGVFNATFATSQQLEAEGSDNYPAMIRAIGNVTSSGVTLASVGATQAGELSNQSIPFNAISSKILGEIFSLPTVASSGLPVTYVSSATNVATVSGSTVAIVGTGPVTITASQAGNQLYAAATSVQQTFTAYAKTVLSVSAIGVPTYDGTTTTVRHYFVGNPFSKYTLEYTTDLNVTSWPSVSVQTGDTGNFYVDFLTSGNYVNAWKSRMFFRAKNS
jgi:hypothetical protein